MTIAAFAGAASSAGAASPGRADLVELTLEAPVVVVAEVASASRLPERLAPGLVAGVRRYLITARASNVLVAPGFVPAEFEYLIDIATDSRGRAPKLKGALTILFLAPGRTERQFALVRPWAQVEWTAEREAFVRSIAAEVVRPGARDFRITGLRQAFHVPGSLPGEGESQIFLDTQTGDPVAIVVLSRPGQERSFTVATGDIIDEAATTVRQGSLLWYHLACNLPPELPAASTETQEPQNARAARSDYRFVRESLGSCDRAYASP